MIAFNDLLTMFTPVRDGSSSDGTNNASADFAFHIAELAFTDEFLIHFYIHYNIVSTH